MRPTPLFACLLMLACSAPTVGTGPAGLEQGLSLFDTLLIERLDPETEYDLGSLTAEARAIFREAGRNELSASALAGLDALSVWAAVQEGLRLSQYAGDPGLIEALDETWAQVTPAVPTLLDAAPRPLPQVQAARIAFLFESGRDAEAAEALGAALRGSGADHAPVHALARWWRDMLPDAQALAATLAVRGGPLDAATAGHLWLSAGIAAQAAGDTENAARLFESGGAVLADVESDPLASSWDIRSRRADCLVNAGHIRFGQAGTRIAEQGIEAAAATLALAEDDYAGALEAVPDDADAARGVALTGDLYYQGGSLDGIRDYFARAARRFDNPEWWNNYAFFCRETERYEESYEAYVRCIALAPDNARWVNDTGLILLYHLERDLDRAEDLFRRAWDLGREVCENPFVSDESYEENFLAYTDAMLNLSLLQANDGRLAEAATLIDELLELAPERPDARQLKADIVEAIDNPTEG